MAWGWRTPSPLGDIFLRSDGEALTGLRFDEAWPEAAERDLPVFRETCRWLDTYFAGGEPDFRPPLRPIGSAFQREVWAALETVPYGQTVTYGALAARLGRPLSPQAVGGALGRNPLLILLPCHRVVGAAGKLTGYAAGVWRKAGLLNLEKG